ncbi:hypothetical protein SNEBB_007601 [Seison nebaliae]|nr:hypothetical protein SNEBB_007601 [Seison nebaliae]
MLVGRFLDQNKNEWYDLPIRIVETKWNHRKSRKCAKFRIPKMNTFYCIVGRNIQYHFIFKNESQHFQIPQLLSIKQRSLMQKNNEKKTMKLSIEVFPLSLEVLDDLLSNENVPMFDNVKYFSNIFNIKQPFPKKRNLKNKIVEMNFVEFKIDLYNLKNLKGIHTLLDFQELILYNTKNNIENFLKDHVEGNNSLSDITECIQEKLQSQLQTQSQIMKQVQSYRGDLESFKQYLRLYTKVLQDSNSKQKYRRLDVSNIRSKMEHLREKDIQVWLKNKSIFEKEEMDDKLWKSYKMEKKEIRKLRLHSPQLTSIAHLRNKPEYFIHNPSSTNTLEETDDVDEWLESLRPIERFKSTFILPSTDYNCLFIMVRTTIQEEYTPNNSNKFLKENELLRKIIKIDENNLEKKSNDENKSFNRIILSNWRILQKSEIASIIVRHHFLHKTNVAIGISLKRYQYSLLDKMSQYGFIYSSMDEKDSLTFICHEGDQLKMECIGNIKLELREMNDDKKVFVFRKNKLSLKLFAMNIDNLNSTNDTVFYGGSIQFTSKLNNEKYKKFYELSKVQNNIINHGCLRLLIKRSIINDTNLSQSTSVNNHITKNNQKNDCEKIIKSNYISEEKEKFDIFIQKLFSFNSILLTEELWEKVGKALRIHILQTDQSLTTNELFTQIFALCDKWYFKQNKKYDKIQLFVRLIRSEKNLNELEKIIEKII